MNTTIIVDEPLAAGAPTALTPEGVLNLWLGFWASKTLLSAVELGVFTHLGHGPLPVNTLIERLGLQQRGARDFPDALVALGMLERGGGSYANAAATDLFLDRNKQAYVGGLLEMANARLYPFCADRLGARRFACPGGARAPTSRRAGL